MDKKVVVKYNTDFMGMAKLRHYLFLLYSPSTYLKENLAYLPLYVLHVPRFSLCVLLSFLMSYSV